MWNKYYEKLKKLTLIPKKVIYFHIKKKIASYFLPSPSKKMFEQIAQCKMSQNQEWPDFQIDKCKVEMIVKELDLRSHIEFKAYECSSHVFDLLGSGSVTVNYKTKAVGFEGYSYKMTPKDDKAYLVKDSITQSLKNDLLQDDLKQHLKQSEPIDWQLDFKSGFSWDSKMWYEDIPIGHLLGVDIKVPWELSRFQHSTKLGLMGLCDKNNNYWKNEFILQVTDWIVSNPHPYGVNWRCTMDVAIRAVNWLWGVILLQDSLKKNIDFKTLLIKSLHIHGVHIENNLEYSMRGYNSNHYLSNLAGLIYIGCLLPCIEESDRWLAFGIQELINEMKYQVYDDGVSYEGSSSYHRLVAEIFYSCTALVIGLDSMRREKLKKYEINKHKVNPKLLPYLSQEYRLDNEQVFPTWYYEKLRKMAEFIKDICKNNGCAPQFGDNDSGRLHVFSPGITEGIYDDASNDQRHILALAGKLFNRSDFTQDGSNYKLDEELLLGQSLVLPICFNKETNTVFRNTKDTVNGLAANGRNYHKFKLTIALKDADKYSFQLSPQVNHYPNAGIAVYKNEYYYFAFTAIPCGLGGKGGHNHNDKLSFELNIMGFDFIVDGGSYVYTPLPNVRNSFRSSWSHNTIAVTGKEQCIMLKNSVFTLIDQSDSHILKVSENMFAGRHQGYGFEHIREVYFNNSEIKIIDKLERREGAFFVLNLHPSVFVGGINKNSLILSRENIDVIVNCNAMHKFRIEEGYYSSNYGKKIANNRIIIPV